MSSKRGESSFNILKQLALYGELAQKVIPEKAKCSYRTVLREIRVLDGLGWIEFVREEREKRKQGPPQNVWKISFQGLMAIIGLLDVFSDDFEKIINAQKNEWIIFEEWDFISRNEEVKTLVLNELKSYCNLHKLNVLIYFSWYKKILYGDDITEEFFENGVIPSLKRDLTKIILGVDNILSFYGSSLRSNFNPRFHDAFLYFLKNPKLKSFIVNQLNYEERRVYGIQRVKRIYNT